MTAEGEFGKFWYLVSTFATDFVSASSECHRKLGSNARLASITSPEELDFIFSLYTEIPQSRLNKGILIGLRRDNNDFPTSASSFTFIDNSSTSFVRIGGTFPWSTGQPNNFQLNKACVEVVANSPDLEVGRLNDVPCGESLPFACKVPRTDFQFEEIDFAGGKFISTPDFLVESFEEANDRCKGMFNNPAATIATFQSIDELTELTGLVRNNSFYVGVKSLFPTTGITNTYFFLDGRNTDIILQRDVTWAAGHPLAVDRTSSCGVAISNKNFIFSDSCLEHYRFGCTLFEDAIIPRHVVFEDNEYLITPFTTSLLPEDANRRCKEMFKDERATLASFSSIEEFEFIEKEIDQTNGGSGRALYWIGLYTEVDDERVEGASEYFFRDGTKNTEAKISGERPWAIGFPEPPIRIGGQCVAIETGIGLVNSACTIFPRPFVCRRASSTPFKTQESIVGEKRFLITESSMRMTVSEAEGQCRLLMGDEGARLASFNSSTEYNVVIEMINDLEGNDTEIESPFIWYWTGLSRTLQSNGRDIDSFFFSDGENSNFIINTSLWLSGQPDAIGFTDGDVESCVGIGRLEDFNDKLLDARCSLRRPFVCSSSLLGEVQGSDFVIIGLFLYSAIFALVLFGIISTLLIFEISKLAGKQKMRKSLIEEISHWEWSET